MKKNTVLIITLTFAGIIAIAAGMICSAFLLSKFMLSIERKTEKSIVVKGVAEKNIISDIAAFRCSISTTNTETAPGYIDLNKKAEVLRKHLKSLGFNENNFEDVNISQDNVFRTETIRENNKNITKQVFSHYSFTYSMRVRTKDVRLVEKNVLKIFALATKGYDVNVSSPEYYISNPEQYKLQLVDEASASAAERARTASAKSGSTLGPLMKARQGVIQITSPASNDTSDYGVYNTSTVEKVMRLVMTLEFELK